MKIHVSHERAPERCVYCHDALSPERLACNACGATYHPECSLRCVTLGCQGVLRRMNRAHAKEDREFAWLATLTVVASIVLPLVLVTFLLSPEIRHATWVVGSIVVAFTFKFVLPLLSSSGEETKPPEAAQATQATAAPAAAPPVPETASEEIALPPMFAAHPIETGATNAAGELEQRLHQREALGDRRPPGLGKTI